MATSASTPISTATAIPTVTSSNDVIFTDGFESGSFSAWSSSVTDGGDLSVTGGAALVGSTCLRQPVTRRNRYAARVLRGGMQAVMDHTNAIYVTDNYPDNEPRYRARFYVDPNSASMANGDNHAIFFAYASGWSSS